MNNGENSTGNDELISSKDIEYTVDLYNPGDNFKVYVPEKWWNSESSLNPTSKYNLRIVKLTGTRKHISKTLFYPGWDINKGDYNVALDNKDQKKEFVKSNKNKIYFLGFAITLIVVVLIVLYVSIILGNGIYSEINIK